MKIQLFKISLQICSERKGNFSAIIVIFYVPKNKMPGKMPTLDVMYKIRPAEPVCTAPTSLSRKILNVGCVEQQFFDPDLGYLLFTL